MKRFCLKDIHWIYTTDGTFVTPFIFNAGKSRIRDLSNDEIMDVNFELYDDYFAKVIKIYADLLNMPEKDLTISKFRELVVNNVLSLKGIKNLKFLKIKTDLLKGHHSKFSSFIVTAEDIKNLTKQISKHFQPQTQKESHAKNLHNITTSF